MARVLFLVHRLPYPPNKGDKVRSFHMLRHLSQRHEVFLGTFMDDTEDEVHLPVVASMCKDMHVSRIDPRIARIRSARGFLTGEPLSLPYYRDNELRSWVARTIDQMQPSVCVVFSSVMADFLPADRRIRTLVDFVDMDSAKWTQYSSTHRWPMSWVYRREGRLLFEFERRIAASVQHSFFVTDAEVKLFTSAAPELADRVGVICNGVDADFFSPTHSGESGFRVGEVPLVFTGAMDYWPNIDAAMWFGKEVLPRIRAVVPNATFYIVGRSPDPALKTLAQESGGSIVVTGTVADVRPYLAHCSVAVAPLRIARGIQNKVLEAMAMGRAVVASAQCAGPIDAVPGTHLLAAETPDEYVDAVVSLVNNRVLADAVGAQARAHVVDHYSWDAHLGNLDRHIEAHLA